MKRRWNWMATRSVLFPDEFDIEATCTRCPWALREERVWNYHVHRRWSEFHQKWESHVCSEKGSTDVQAEGS